MADHNENGILEGAIKRGVDFIKGPEGKLQQLHVNTSFLADCSPMDVMFRVRDNGEVEDMRPQFLTELLKMDGVWYSTGKVSGAAGDAGYRKFYTLDIGECDCPVHSKGHPTHSRQHPTTCASQQSTGPSGIHRVAFVAERSRWQKLIFQCRQPAVVYNQPILWVSLVVRSTGSFTIWERCNYRREQMPVEQGPHT